MLLTSLSMNPLLLALSAGLLGIAGWGLLRRPKHAENFVRRWGIEEANLYVRTDIPADLPKEVYERRVRTASLLGNSTESNFALPLEVEEFRLVTTRPGLGFQRAVAEWQSNAYESRENGKYEIRPLMAVRPLTPEERRTEWPRLAALSAQCDRELHQKTLLA